jgi:quercetin dioxygenase-like cupin family protein
MIFVRRGWVRVVYEDQGAPFVMQAGDLVLQPPGIRHRVLESSSGAEVIEVGCPALHETFADHELILPTADVDTGRDFGGQTFLRHVAAKAPWTPYGGGESQDTGMAEATKGLAEVRTVRRGAGSAIEFPSHEGELVFGFVLEGSARLDHGQGVDIGSADALVIPPGERWSLSGFSPDFRLLHVTTWKMT